MDGVHSSSLKNIVQGESVGARPRERTETVGGLAGLIPAPILAQVAPGVSYRLNSRDMTFRRIIII